MLTYECKCHRGSLEFAMGCRKPQIVTVSIEKKEKKSAKFSQHRVQGTHRSILHSCCIIYLSKKKEKLH